MLDKKFDNLIFIDTETTGVEADDKLFQVSYKFQNKETDGLFKPSKEISIEAMEVTHVTNQDVKNKEIFIGSVIWKELKNILSNSENIFVAHNAKFDIAMIEKEDLKVNKFIDTLKVAQYLDSEAKIPSYRLQYLRYFLNLEVKDAQAHNALGDIRVLEVLFKRLYDKLFEKLKEHQVVLEKMIEISTQPILIKRINFGKHKGKLISEVAKEDQGYLEWLLREKQKQAAEGQIGEDWIYTLEYYLK